MQEKEGRKEGGISREAEPLGEGKGPEKPVPRPSPRSSWAWRMAFQGSEETQLPRLGQAPRPSPWPTTGQRRAAGAA